MKRIEKLTLKQKDTLHTFMKNSDCSGREVRRAQAVLLIDEDVSVSAITAMTQYKKRRIFELRGRFLLQGTNALKDRRKGQPKELLTRKQRAEIIDIIQTKKPSELDDYFKNYDFWTTGALGEYIKRTYDVQYKSKTSHYLLFRQARFTYHKPGRIYHERNQEEVETWKKQACRRLAKLWKEKNTVILTADEMILTTRTTIQKIWLKAGEYPKIDVPNHTILRRNVYGFLNVRSGAEHAFKTEKQNMYVTVDILKKIRNIYPKQKIVLWWDNAGWHRGSQVQQYIKKDNNIETIHFPRYAPEENPQEHVWKNGRSHCTHNRFIENIDTATNDLVNYFKSTKFPYQLLGFSAVS